MRKFIVVHTIHEGDYENALNGEFIEVHLNEPLYVGIQMADGKSHAIPHRIITKITTWTEA